MEILETPITSTDLDTKFQMPERVVLVVEDDLALRPLWEMAFRRQKIKLDWATSMEDAERLIRFRYRKGGPYTMVVADIFLEGKGSGIDLWNRYGEEAENFVFVSGLPISRFEFLMSLNYGCPLYLKKPLTPKMCREIAEMVLKE